MARILFERKPVGTAMGALSPPRATVAPAPVVMSANVGNAPQRHVSPARPHAGVGSAKGYRAMILHNQRNAARTKPFSTH